MQSYLFGVDILYTDFDGSTKKEVYKVFAQNNDNAILIAREIFFTNVGLFNDMQIIPHIELPTDTESAVVKNRVNELLQPLKKLFVDCNYKGFLNNYVSFLGFDISLSPNESSYWFTFKDLTCKLVYKNGIVYIDESLLKYRGSNRLYILLDNQSKIYIGG